MQKDDKKPEQVAKQVEQIKNQIDQLLNDQGLLVDILKKVKEWIVQHHLGIIAVMYYNGSLYKLLSVLHSHYQRQKNKEMLEALYMMFNLAVECLFNFDSEYRKLLKSFNTKLPDMKKYKQFLKEQVIKEYQTFKDLIKYFMEIKSFKKIESFEKGLRLNEYANNLLLKHKIQHNFANQVIISWLRIEVSQIQANIFKEKSYKVGYCCNLHFKQSSIPFNLDFENHAYININPNQIKLFENVIRQNRPYTTLVQVQNIKKWLVYFLNNQGGHLFLGIKQLKGKIGTLNGIPLSKQQRFNYLKALQKEVIIKIFPTDNENEEQDDKAQQQRLKRFVQEKENLFSQQVKQKYTHSLSELIDVDFIHIYNDKTLIFERLSNGNMLFVIRFRVKVGNPAQVYHFLNQKDMPEAFIQSNKALNMIQYYDLVYSRLKDQANGKAIAKQPKTHALCIYPLKYEKKKQQTQSLSSDSSDDD